MVGHAGVIRHEGRKVQHKGTIWGVHVTAAARGQGVATAMLTQLLDRVRGYSGLEHVTLSVSVPQEAARRLYRALGFAVYGYEAHALKVGETYVDDEHMVLWLRTPLRYKARDEHLLPSSALGKGRQKLWRRRQWRPRIHSGKRVRA